MKPMVKNPPKPLYRLGYCVAHCEQGCKICHKKAKELAAAESKEVSA